MTKHKLFARALYAVMALALVAGLTLVPATASASVTGITNVAPSEASPAYVSPGGSVDVAFNITTDAAEDVDVRILIADGTIGDSGIFTVTTAGAPNTSAVSKTVGIDISAEEGAKYTLTAKAKTVGDAEWTTMTENDAVIVDSVAPAVTIDAITEYANPSAINGTASDAASDVILVKLLIKDETDNTYWNESTWGGTVTWLLADDTETWSYSTGLPACWTDGHIYTVTARATDEAENTTLEANRPSATFTADNVVPVVTITTIVDDPTNEAPSVIEGTSTDVRSGVKSVNVQVAYDASYYWDGSHWVVADSWVEAEGTTSWSFTMPTLTSGRTYNITAKATDNADNDSTLDTIGFAYNAIAPTVAITAPSAGYYKADFDMITGNSTAGADGKVELLLKDNTANKYWDGDSWEDASSWLDATNPNGWATWSYNVTGLSDDAEENGEFSDGSSYTVTAKATDALGNYSTAQATFTYDVSAPAVTIDDIADYVASLAEITGTASDAGSGVVSVNLTIVRDADSTCWNGSAWITETWLAATFTEGAWSYNSTGVGFENGKSYTVTAKATDDLGTVTDGADQPSDSFTLDSLPEVTIIDIANSVSELESITGTATDTAPGSVTLVQLQIKNTIDSTYWTGSAWGAETWLDAATANEWANWSFSTSSVSFADGSSYTVSAKSKDNVGQWSDIVEDSFTFDTSGPIVTIKDLPAEARPDTISGVASDVGSGVASVELTIVRDEDSKYWDGDSWEEESSWLSATGTAAWTYDVSGVSFEVGKSYTVTAKATDNLDIVTAEADQPSETFTYGGIVTKSTTIDLESGWNLISLPLIPTNSNIETGVLADLIDAGTVIQVRTWVWEAGVLVEKAWLGVGHGEFTTMKDGQGYWIEMDAAGALVVTGSELPAPPQTPPSYDVCTGWNMVGFKSLTEQTATEYLGALVIGTMEAMYGYDAAAGTYTIIGEASPNLVPGDGYWLAVNADGTIYP